MTIGTSATGWHRGHGAPRCAALYPAPQGLGRDVLPALGGLALAAPSAWLGGVGAAALGLAGFALGAAGVYLLTQD